MERIFGFRRKSKQSEKNPICNDLEIGCDEEINGLSQLYSPQKDNTPDERDVLDVLLEMGKMTDKQFTKVREKHKKSADCDICQIITELKIANKVEISTAQATLHGFEFKQIEVEQVDREAFCKLDLDYIKSNRIIPIKVKGKNLIVATSRPSDLFVIEDVKSQTQMNVETFVCTDEDIDKVCSHFDGQKGDYNIDDIMDDMADVEVVQDQEDDSEDLEQMAGQSPVIKFVNYLISNAVREGASDIHIELSR
ncbi:MAG: GspE/PulE/PilB domain-containing protein [Planctomycetota bacterium]|jgi:type IV pilus assembly protein PilB